METPNKKILLWDLGGQKNLRQIWSKYYRDCDAMIFVVNILSSDEKIQEAKECFSLYIDKKINEEIKLIHPHS